MNLSDELPLIASFGFKVVDEYVRPVHIAHMKEVELDNYRFDVRDELIPAIMTARTRSGTRCGPSSPAPWAATA